MEKDERLTGRRNMPCGQTVLKEGANVDYSRHGPFSFFRSFYAEAFEEVGRV